ncbi:MAG TPA: HNH endonuclease [Xanthobacteraceae bacterium]|jgi:putative restriction endonuclease|nr:HNH endonuclease [Xanthobacteraceae bacterium]
MALSATQLLELVESAVRSSGWRCFVLSARKPFDLRVSQDDGEARDLVVYIWNCTHGGGAARAADEYRIQFTTTVPRRDARALTLLLGWHQGYEVFAAWDVLRHDGQNTQSPSAQIKEATLAHAAQHGFGFLTKQSGEIAVAFRPELFMTYAVASAELHQTGAATADFSMLSNIESITETTIDEIADARRRLIVSRIVRKYRAADFRKRVLTAYRHRCAMCGIQLELIDAAHIVPVAATESSDETRNGVALCKLHHAAYDRNFVSFDENLRIEVSTYERTRLDDAQRTDGLEGFEDTLRDRLLAAAHNRDRPSPELITLSRRLRRWR